MIIRGGSVLNESFCFEKTDIKTDGDKIACIGDCFTDNVVVDATGCYVVPGFIETHSHGALGENFVDFNEETFEKVARFQAKRGTTSYTPTLSAAPKEKLIDGIRYIKKCCESITDGCSELMGIHLEGPFFAERYKGAHLPENIRNPKACELEEYVCRANGWLKILTMAPELEGADETIKKAVASGVCVSAGHTDATFEQINHAIEVGVTQGTHLFNAMKPLSHREPGTVGALLADADIKCELICDFVHVHPDVIKLVYKIKGRDKINVITDSELGTGMPDGEYRVNGRTIIVKDKKTFIEDGVTLAGGSTCLADCVKNLVSIGIPLEDACLMASKNPAETLGVYNKKGSLSVGKTADIVILNKDLTVKNVILRGKLL